MFLPFETSFSMWFAAMPQYEWLPAAPAGAERGADDECHAGITPAAPVSWAVVFRGIEWSAYPVWQAQANPAWESVAQNRVSRIPLNRLTARPVSPGGSVPQSDTEIGNPEA